MLRCLFGALVAACLLEATPVSAQVILPRRVTASATIPSDTAQKASMTTRKTMIGIGSLGSGTIL